MFKPVQTQHGAGPTIAPRATPVSSRILPMQAANTMPGVQALAKAMQAKAQRDHQAKMEADRLAQQKSLAAQAQAAASARAAAGREHEERMLAMRGEQKLKTERELMQERLRFAQANSPVANMTDEEIVGAGVPAELIPYVRKNPQVFETVRSGAAKHKREIELQRERATAAEKTRLGILDFKNKQKKAKETEQAQNLMGVFEVMQRDLAPLSPEAVDSVIGAQGNSETWQAIRNWWTNGGNKTQEAQIVIEQSLGSIESELMGTLKGNPSDLDVRIALQMIRAAKKAEDPQTFFKAVGRAQEILARKLGLKPDQYKKFSDPFARKKLPRQRRATRDTIIRHEGVLKHYRGGKWVPIREGDGGVRDNDITGSFSP
jgi:hypothetical protein